MRQQTLTRKELPCLSGGGEAAKRPATTGSKYADFIHGKALASGEE